MSYLQSSSLGKEAKKIISSIGESGKDITGGLRGSNEEFLKKEILNYIKNDFDLAKDGKARFSKVLRVLSFEVDNTPEYQKLFLQILAKYPEFSEEIVPALDKKTLSKDVTNIYDLNISAFNKSIDKKHYNEIVLEIINKNINSEKLHEVIYSSLENFGKDCPVNKLMTHAYLTHPQMKEDKVNDILSLWSENADIFGKIDLDEQEKKFFDMVQIEYLRSRNSDKKMSSQARAFLVASLSEGNKMKVSVDVLEEALSMSIKIYKKSPDINLAVHKSLENMSKHHNMPEIMNDMLRLTAGNPELTDTLLQEVKKNQKKYKADMVAVLPFLAELHPEHKGDYIAVVAKAVRNSSKDDELAEMLSEHNVYTNSKGDDVFVDIFSDSYKYLAYIAFNDSKMDAFAALDLSDEILHNLKDGLNSVDAGDEDDDDNEGDMFPDSEKKELYGYVSDYLNIMSGSSILNSDKDCYSRFIAGLKAGEITGQFSEDINQMFNNIYIANIQKVDTAVFIDEILSAKDDYANNYSNEDEKILVDKNSKSTFAFVENYIKRAKLKTDDIETTMSILEEHKASAQAKDLKNYDKLISLVSIKKMSSENVDKYIRGNLGRNSK